MCERRVALLLLLYVSLDLAIPMTPTPGGFEWEEWAEGVQPRRVREDEPTRVSAPAPSLDRARVGAGVRAAPPRRAPRRERQPGPGATRRVQSPTSSGASASEDH